MESLNALLVGLSVAAQPINLLYALIGSALRGWLAQGRRLLWFNRALAGVLALTALWMGTL